MNALSLLQEWESLIGESRVHAVRKYYTSLRRDWQECHDIPNNAIRLSVELEDVPHFPEIVAIWFYRRIPLLPIPRILPKGLSLLFSTDLESNHLKFLPLYKHCWESLQSPHVTNIEPNTLLDLLKVVLRFFFFYEHRLKTEMLSEIRQSTEDPSSQWVELPDFLWQLTNSLRKVLRLSCKQLSRSSGMADLFVEECILMVQECGNSNIAFQYVQEFGRFEQWKLSRWTSNKLQVLLYQLSTPGAPWYTPRPLRLCSSEALDILFPVCIFCFFSYFSHLQYGKTPRSLIRNSFRLLQPHYIPSSLFHWTFLAIDQFLDSLQYILGQVSDRICSFPLFNPPNIYL